MYTATSTYAVIRVWGSTRAQPPFPFHGSAKACLLEHPHGRRSRFPSLSSRGTDFSPSAKKGILVRERATRAGNKTGVRTAARPLLHQPGTKEVGPANPPCEPRTTTTKGACSERSGTARTGTRMAVMEDIRGPDLRHATADLDPESFTWLKELSYKENLTSLNLVKFLKSATKEYQYLDVGCGPGNFLAERLLPRLHPFARVVSTDISEDMIQYAQEHHKKPKVNFEVLDIEKGDVHFIINRYGLFDRLYSFLTFHYIWDLPKVYRNISRLLKDGGECLVVYFTRTGITDVWHQIYQNEEWQSYMPDLSSMFAERYCFNEPVDEKKLGDLEKSAVKAAGLELVACHTYSSVWTFSSADACLEHYRGPGSPLPPHGE
ncbi:uncharacterized protein LOC119185270 isoform X2 [Rhipicephalus microplus]|uniref:uncharacterized protein LOC119185270 isoform X2 n=1 Tax=Rhipicephalus microplus TaxID=6941 RepID=UPI003F6ABA19